MSVRKFLAMFRGAAVACAIVSAHHPARAWALNVGERLPEPPAQTVDSARVDTARWLRDGLVVWYLFDPANTEAVASLRWLAVPPDARPGVFAVAVPVGDGAAGLAARADGLPVLADGERWRVALGPGMRPPLLIVTRPPGIVAEIRQGPLAAPSRIPVFSAGLHVQREDWAAAQSVIARADAPLVDPTLHVARAYAALGSGATSVAREEGAGLAEVGPTPGFKAAGHAVLAALALRDGDLDSAVAHARRASPSGEGEAMQARVELVRGDVAAAARHALRAADATAATPWGKGAHARAVAHVAYLRGRPQTALPYALRAVRAAPGSWQALQVLGLSTLQTGNEDEGRKLLAAAAALAPDSSRAAGLAAAATRATGAGASAPAAVVVVLEAGSIPHDTWSGAGPTACLMLADALTAAGPDEAAAYALGPVAAAEGHPFGAPLDAAAALRAAQHSGAESLVLLRMHAMPRGVMLNARLLAADSGALLGMESMLWAPGQSLDGACHVLADRLARRLRAAR